MLGAIKTIGTLLTVATTAHAGKELYSKIKTAKREKELAEVHDFLENIDLKLLKKAIKTEDQDLLITAVESILDAAEKMRKKTQTEELIEDVTSTAKSIFSTVSDVADKVITGASVIIDEAKEEITKRNTRR